MKHKFFFQLGSVLLALLCSIPLMAQKQSFTDIHKLVEAKKFKEAIPQLKKFIESDAKHVSAHYDLANCYAGILDDLVKIQNANVNNQNTSLWSDKEYKDNLNFWKNGINVTDSAIYFYKQTSELMNIQFLTLDLRYNEFYEATKDCSVIQKVKCARNYLAKVIDELEKTNVSNKSRLFNEEKNYEAFKKKNQSTYTGTYKYSYGEEGANGTLSIQQMDDKIKFSIYAETSKGNIGEVEGIIPIKNDVAIYESNDENGHCKFKIMFSIDKVIIEYLDNAFGCGLGNGVEIAETYKKNK